MTDLSALSISSLIAEVESRGYRVERADCGHDAHDSLGGPRMGRIAGSGWNGRWEPCPARPLTGPDDPERDEVYGGIAKSMVLLYGLLHQSGVTDEARLVMVRNQFAILERHWHRAQALSLEGGGA